MSTDPNERLAALRREVEAETARVPTTPPPASPPVSSLPTTPPPVAPAPPSPPPVPSSPAPAVAPPAKVAPAADPRADVPDDRRGWDLEAIFADTSLTTWVSLGLLALGGYMVLSWFVPGIDFIGSLLILVIGVVLLAQHLQRGAGSWALYAGALLAGAGAGRLVGDILPGSWSGLTAIGVGLAFLAIGYMRHSQAGGYGWQGILGGGVLALGAVQLLLSWLPGSPGIVDLILPALLIVGGFLLLGHARRRSAPSSRH